MSAKTISTQTYDYACFLIIAYEYGDNKIKDSEKKIKAKLKYHQFGAYNEARVNNLRTLKEELATEIGLHKQSVYYTTSHGEYCNMEDFDYKKMSDLFSKKYSSIAEKELASIVMLAIDLFYLR